MNDSTSKQPNPENTKPSVYLSKIGEILKIDSNTIENAVKMYTKVQQCSTLSTVLETHVCFNHLQN